MSEEILGNTEVTYSRSAWSYIEEDILFFTSKRLIVAKISSSWSRYPFLDGGIPLMIERHQQKQKKEKAGEASPEEVLAMDKKNFAMPYSEIEKVMMKKPGAIFAAQVEIVTKEKTHQFGVRKNLFEDFIRLTQLVLSDKTTVE